MRRTELKDVKGLRFGRLVIYALAGLDRQQNTRVKAKCDCGFDWVGTLASLRRGTKSCGCFRTTSAAKEIGKRFEKLVVLAMVPTRGKSRISNIVKALCDCGKTWVGPIKRLLAGGTKSCGCMKSRSIPFSGAAKKRIWNQYVHGAKLRGYCWRLSRRTFDIIVAAKACFHCGGSDFNVARSYYNAGDFAYMGIDRLNNRRGYYADNCVPCCKTCNIAKRDLSADDFDSWVKKVHAHKFPGAA